MLNFLPVFICSSRSLYFLILFQLLFGHEIDRIVAWHNPLGAEEKILPDEREFSLDARLQVSFLSPVADQTLLCATLRASISACV
jgi:hypothetical protein